LGHIAIDIIFSCLSDQQKASAEGATDQLTIKNIYVCILILLSPWSLLPLRHLFCIVVVAAAAVVVDNNKNKIVIIVITLFLLLSEFTRQSCDTVNTRSHKL
jgi:hypothetical protein